MESADLRPQTLGELLDRTFSLYRANFWLFVGIMAVPSAFSIPFNIAFMSSRNAVLPGAVRSAAAVTSVFLFVGITLVLAWVSYSLAIGAATYAVSETYLGRKVTVRGSFGKVSGQFWKIVGVVLVAFLRSIGMFLLVEGAGAGLIVGGLFIGMGMARAQGGPVLPIIFGILIFVAYFAGICLWLVWSLRYAVCIPALLLEHLGVLAALRRSVHLTSGRRWQLLVAVLLCTMIAYVGVIVFQGPFFVAMMLASRAGQPPEWLVFASSVFGAIGGSITGSILMIVLVLCYYDTRIRKEAFDLQFMMSALDPATRASEPGTASPA